MLPPDGDSSESLGALVELDSLVEQSEGKLCSSLKESNFRGGSTKGAVCSSAQLRLRVLPRLLSFDVFLLTIASSDIMAAQGLLLGMCLTYLHATE